MRFDFDIANGHNKSDFRGISCSSSEDARLMADQLAADFKRNHGLENTRGLYVVVTDEAGVAIYKAAISSEKPD